jgi:carbon-monoxide dehydrogenase small subunit
MIDISITVNGTQTTGTVEPRLLLVDYLRVNLRLTGTHVGCDTSQCGACTVIVDGRSVKACTMLAVQVHGKDVKTIEGVAAEDGTLHPMQEAFRENHGLQCGFCTPGMVMSALALVERSRGDGLSEASVRSALEGNLCRCTGYQSIVKSIAAGARAMGLDVA